jgi:methionyl aminopeptidase
VRDYVGHGIGKKMWEEPSVPNYGTPGKGLKLAKGLVIAVEPMVNVGTYDVRDLSDGWTVVTKDGKLSAHYENTIAILDGGPKILTLI